MLKLICILFLFPLFLFTLNVKQASAASSIIGVTPQTGTFDKPFIIHVTIDGHGDKFNAAQATVTLSANMAIQNLVLGDCKFSFLTVPSVQDPSFAGIIFSSYKKQCTLYTLSLVPTAKGAGSIKFTHASVKRFGDAANILSTVQNGSYTLTAALKAPTANSLTTDEANKGLYSLFLNIVTPQNIPLTNASVDLSSVTSKTLQMKTTDSNGSVHFSNLQEGIYDAVITKNNRRLEETIINVRGKNHVMTVGLSVEDTLGLATLKNIGPLLTNLESSPLLIIGILLLGIVIGTGIAIFFVTIRRRKA